MKRIALVTGANKGIGFAVAQGLGELGHTVLLGARDVGRGEQARNALRDTGVDDVHLVAIDVADDASVADAAHRIDLEFGRLDTLVNNAGVKLEFHPAPPSQASMEEVRATYATNVFGTMSVTLAMLPLLRRSEAGRIVNLSSGLGSLGLAADTSTVYATKCMLGYNTSKTAINAVTLQFANELRAGPIKVNAADPGYTNTDMTHRDGARTASQAARVAIRLATLPDDGPTGAFFDNAGPLPW
ncbi:MAG TPA: SDR family NAD(P)-dependent oxidoreductase [Mycobacteriales bacterium]|jgi:NAD(P)-dependent dehydrogenase (short-subunit alcohol dehydrogenase family)|nr:SDR family NAD(P)-dependent oxidoreductase [Mycobacteriales bacterium]